MHEHSRQIIPLSRRRNLPKQAFEGLARVVILRLQQKPLQPFPTEFLPLRNHNNKKTNKEEE